MWEATVSVEVETVATPAVLKFEPPSVFTPSRKVTVPVGAPGLTAFTVAVRVTGCPAADGFVED